jgi:hypothetical protein
MGGLVNVVGFLNNRQGRQQKHAYSRITDEYFDGTHTEYEVSPARVGTTASTFSQIVPVPQTAEHVRFHRGKLPKKYQQALQDVR